MFFAIFIGLAVLALSVYFLLTWNFDYWKKQGIDGPKPKLLVGNFPNVLNQKRHMAEDADTIYRAYRDKEDFVGIFSMKTPQLMILNPELIHRVLVNDFKHFHDNEASKMLDAESDFIFGNNPFVLKGEKWKEVRAEITPGLTVGRIKTVYPVTRRVCQNLSNYIEKESKIAGNNGLDTKDICLRFTSEVVTDCVLGLKADSLTDKPTPILAMTKKLFEQSFTFIFQFMLLNLIPQIRFIYKMRFIPKSVEKFFVELLQKAIDIRKAEPQRDRVDFLNYMLQLQEKKNLSTNIVTSHTMTFLLDGFETTATAIAHCLLFLARYPEAQEKLREEIEKNLDDNKEIDFEALNDMPYLDACIHEAIRIFPPALFSSKVVTEPIELTSKSGKKVKLKNEDVVFLPHYSVMLDENYYPNPEEFKPERFLEETGGVKKYRELGLYNGFSDGPRICMGMRFALTQSKASIAEIIKNFNIRVNPKTRKDNQLDATYFLAQLQGGIWLDFEKRT